METIRLETLAEKVGVPHAHLDAISTTLTAQGLNEAPLSYYTIEHPVWDSLGEDLVGLETSLHLIWQQAVVDGIDLVNHARRP